MTQGHTNEPTLGIIGGSGLYELPGLDDVERVEVQTPFGAPSDPLLVGRLQGKRLVFLARHGVGHRLLPSELPFLANLWALKSLGCRYVLSLSAVGSLREEVSPGDVVVVDQFVDRTRNRPRSFFGDGCVAHVSMADPVSPVLRKALLQAARSEGVTAHDGGAYVCIEGPAFGTRADSELYRSWGMTVVGMTNWPEAPLARECEMAYATLALVTDYDCWKTDDHVTVDAVVAQLHANADLATRVVGRVARELDFASFDPSHDALKPALMTQWDAIPAPTLQRLAPLLERYRP